MVDQSEIGNSSEEAGKVELRLSLRIQKAEARGGDAEAI